MTRLRIQFEAYPQVPGLFEIHYWSYLIFTIWKQQKLSSIYLFFKCFILISEPRLDPCAPPYPFILAEIIAKNVFFASQTDTSIE